MTILYSSLIESRRLLRLIGSNEITQEILSMSAHLKVEQIREKFKVFPNKLSILLGAEFLEL